MKLLIVLSSNDFDNFTRRATVEAICKQHPETTLLFFNGIKGFPISKPSNKKLTWKAYYSLSLGQRKNALRKAEIAISGLYWKNFIQLFDTIFLTDPNQELLMDYSNRQQKIVYLIRDPNILQSSRNKERELRILQTAEIVFATSKNLAEIYLPKYYGFQHPNIHFWPNTVDLNIWDYTSLEKQIKPKGQKVIGMAGNIGNKRTDFALLEYVADNMTECEIQFAGKISPNSLDNPSLQKFLNSKNVKYLGFVPFAQLPATLINWDVGLVTECQDEYARFMHHNKVYQYLAMGLPVVSMKIHNDYERLQPFVQSVASYNDYIEAIDIALQYSKQEKFGNKCIEKALENSAEKRAEDFLKWVNKP